MACVIKRPASPYWYACYTSREGRQLKRSTKVAARRKALQIAVELEEVESQARRSALTTTQLRKILSDVSEKVTGDGLSVPSTEAYLNEWLKLIGTRIQPTTLVRYKGTVENFLKHLGPKARQPVTQVAPQDIERFMSARLGVRCAPKTTIVDLKTLGTAFRRAEAYGVILKNPVAAVRPPKDEGSERDVFTQEELQKLLDAAPSLEWQTLILLGYFLGARLSDCVRLEWQNVHPEEGVIVYSQRKTGKKVVVPMHYHVIEHLNYLSQFGTAGYLCPTLVQRVVGGRNGLSGAFKRIVVRAGIDPGIVEGKGMRKFTKRTFHSLRHSFTSALANAGIAEEVRMKLTGHSSKPVHHGYTHLELSALKSAVSALPLFTRREPEPVRARITDSSSASSPPRDPQAS
jgi:integrase